MRSKLTVGAVYNVRLKDGSCTFQSRLAEIQPIDIDGHAANWYIFANGIRMIGTSNWTYGRVENDRHEPAMGVDLVYVTVGDFYRLCKGFMIRDRGVYAQLGQGAPFSMFKQALLQAEKEMGQKRAAVRFDSFVCRECRERYGVHQKKGETPISADTVYCDECAPPKRRPRGR